MTGQCDKSSVNRPETIREIRYEKTRDATAKPDARGTLTLTPPLVGQVNAECHVDRDDTALLIDPRHPDRRDAGMLGGENQGAPNHISDFGAGHRTRYPCSCGRRPIVPGPTTAGAPISAVTKRAP